MQHIHIYPLINTGRADMLLEPREVARTVKGHVGISAFRVCFVVATYSSHLKNEEQQCIPRHEVKTLKIAPEDCSRKYTQYMLILHSFSLVIRIYHTGTQKLIL